MQKAKKRERENLFSCLMMLIASSSSSLSLESRLIREPSHIVQMAPLTFWKPLFLSRIARMNQTVTHTHTSLIKKIFVEPVFSLSLSAHRGVDSCVTQRMEISLIGIGGDKNDVGCRLQELLLPLFRQLVFFFSFFFAFFSRLTWRWNVSCWGFSAYQQSCCCCTANTWKIHKPLWTMSSAHSFQAENGFCRSQQQHPSSSQIINPTRPLTD